MGQEFAVVRRCRTCGGRGEVDDPHCRVCGQRSAADDPWWLAEEETLMPCGHPADTSLAEMVTCSECDGVGRSQQWAGRSEWLAVQAGWAARYLFVLLAILIPVFVLAAIIGREHGDWLCGNWWYGVALPFLFVYSGKNSHG
jgi:hypothetical protein